ncbi:MAG: hypothetical protein RL226_1100, partial [Bacteroidota bacterium]
VQIFDLSGRMVLAQAVRGHTTVALSNLSAGVYAVQLIQNGTSLGTQKMIVE